VIARLRERLAERDRARRGGALCLCGHPRLVHDDHGEGACVEGWVCSLTDGRYVWRPVARFCLCSGFVEARTPESPARERLHCGPTCECHRANPRPAREDNA
jgi:hypothetical protein